MYENSLRRNKESVRASDDEEESQFCSASKIQEEDDLSKESESHSVQKRKKHSDDGVADHRSCPARVQKRYEGVHNSFSKSCPTVFSKRHVNLLTCKSRKASMSAVFLQDSCERSLDKNFETI
jgi:hypothetical protein